MENKVFFYLCFEGTHVIHCNRFVKLCARVLHTQVFLEAQYEHHVIGDPSIRYFFTLSDELYQHGGCKNVYC
jgi:hypothetical protein